MVIVVLIAEVPDVLKKLARVVARAFYTHVDVVIVDALVHHTWYTGHHTLLSVAFD